MLGPALQQRGVDVVGLEPADQGLAEAAGFAPAAARVEPEPDPTDAPLGAARAQLHENWIVAQTADMVDSIAGAAEQP